MVVYMRYILYIYSHFPCLKVFFKGRCSFLLLFLNLWGTWMTRILPLGIGDPHLVQSWWVVSRNQFIWNSLDDLPWFLVIYDDLPWFLVMKNPCFLMKKLQSMFSYETIAISEYLGGSIFWIFLLEDVLYGQNAVRGWVVQRKAPIGCCLLWSTSYQVFYGSIDFYIYIWMVYLYKFTHIHMQWYNMVWIRETIHVFEISEMQPASFLQCLVSYPYSAW